MVAFKTPRELEIMRAAGPVAGPPPERVARAAAPPGGPAALAAAVPGNRIGDISHAVESVGRAAGYGILQGCTGHGIGTAMHEDPTVPNTGRPRRGLRLREGLTIAIEPMLIEGGHDGGRNLPDGWAIAAADGSRAAHFEHTIAVTADGPVILTVP